MMPGELRVAVVAADFNQAIVGPMIETAEAELRHAKATVTGIYRVSGCYEAPLIANALLASAGIDALIVLGYIEQGETLHGEVMGHVVHAALVDLQLKYNKPIGLGIIGPGATLDQAEVRKVRSARSAVRAALENLACLQKATATAL